jgi:hypothetical protein
VVPVRDRRVVVLGLCLTVLLAGPMRAPMVGRASLGVLVVHLDSMLLDLVALLMMKVPLVKAVDVVPVPDGRVAALPIVPVRMLSMSRSFLWHDAPPSFAPGAASWVPLAAPLGALACPRRNDAAGLGARARGLRSHPTWYRRVRHDGLACSEVLPRWPSCSRRA